MLKVAPLLVLRLALFIAVFACAVLVVDYENLGDPSFCGVGSGCMAVRRSSFSSVGGIPLPIIGLCAHASLLALVLVAREKSHTFFIAVAAAGGAAVAIVLVAIQALKIGAWCRWCLAVDAGAVVAAMAAAYVHYRTATSERYEVWLADLAARRVQVVAWAAGTAIAAGLPFVWGEYPVIPPLPPPVAALQVPGKLTIVSFTDFECPFCRRLHPVIHEIQENWGDRTALVRKMAPLPGHEGAMPAALAYACTPQERREEMAHVLYRAPEELLNRAGTIAFAEQMHLDGAAFGRCLDAPATRAMVDRDLEVFQGLAAKALPLTYVGPRVVMGYNPERARRSAALGMEGDRPALPASWMLAAAGLLGLVLVAATLRMAPGKAGTAAPAAPATS
jgi:uncharacterized membrane protein